MPTFTDHDLVWRITKNNLETELRESREQANITGVPAVQLPAVIKFLDAEFGFTTSTNFFRNGKLSGQPFYFTSNLSHVVNLARQEGRQVETMMGVCLHSGEGRIFATNGKHYIGARPKYKELWSDGLFTLNDLLGMHLARRNYEFPGGKPDVGLLEEYKAVFPSALRLEPSMGKVLKFANQFELANAFGIPLTLFIPTHEYLTHETGYCNVFNPRDIEKDTLFEAEVLGRTMRTIHKKFFPHVQLEIIDTRSDSCRRNIESILSVPSFQEAVRSLKPEGLSYAAIDPSCDAYKQDSEWTALFLGSKGRIPLGKDDPSKVIFVHYRDFGSFALVSPVAIEKMSRIEGAGISWKDRIAVVGISGGPDIRLLTDEERVRRLAVNYRLSGDDYMAYPESVLFLGEDHANISDKIDQISPAKNEMYDPLYTIIRKGFLSFYPHNKEAHSWIESYRTRTPENRCETGKAVLKDLTFRLKEDLQLA